jgi:hypothetical protein
MTTGEVELTSYDYKIAAALTAFSKLVKRAAKATFQGFLSIQEAEVRRQHLLQIANDAETLARHPPTATYQAFERLFNTAGVAALGYPAASIDFARLILCRAFRHPLRSARHSAKGKAGIGSCGSRGNEAWLERENFSGRSEWRPS